jgi:hypothetical protein
MFRRGRHVARTIPIALAAFLVAATSFTAPATATFPSAFNGTIVYGGHADGYRQIFCARPTARAVA